MNPNQTIPYGDVQKCSIDIEMSNVISTHDFSVTLQNNIPTQKNPRVLTRGFLLSMLFDYLKSKLVLPIKAPDSYSSTIYCPVLSSSPTV
jgi:hypothetical protein